MTKIRAAELEVLRNQQSSELPQGNFQRSGTENDEHLWAFPNPPLLSTDWWSSVKASGTYNVDLVTAFKCPAGLIAVNFAIKLQNTYTASNSNCAIIFRDYGGGGGDRGGISTFFNSGIAYGTNLIPIFNGYGIDIEVIAASSNSLYVTLIMTAYLTRRY